MVIHRAVKADLKLVEDGPPGAFNGYAAIFGIPDLQGDVIEPGAFTRTLRHWNDSGKRIPILWQHRPDDVIGVDLGMAHEDARGLAVSGQLAVDDVQKAKEAHALMRMGALGGLSFAYEVVTSEWDGDLRRLKELRLLEYSPVTWPAQPLTSYQAKGVVPFQALPLADKARAWDGAAAVARVRAWAGGEEMDWAKYRKAFMWFDAANGQTLGAYKLPIADIIDGTLTAIPRAILAVGGVLQGARGGVDIPAGDLAGVKRNLARYYGQLDMTPPWESEAAALVLGDLSMEMKIGRVLSSRNQQLLSDAVAALQALLAAAAPPDPESHSDEDEGDEGPATETTCSQDDLDQLAQAIRLQRLVKSLRSKE